MTQYKTIDPKHQETVIACFWAMMRELESEADNNQDRVLMHFVDGYARTWNEITGGEFETVWAKRKKQLGNG